VESNLSSLVVYVVDFDGQGPASTPGVEPLVGPLIQGLARTQVASGTPTLGWGPLSGSDFDYDPIAVRQAVYDWKAWAAIIIMPNATSQLYNAVQNGNTSYDPMGACQLIYQSSRDDTNWFDFMYPIISQFQTQATSMVGQQWAKLVLQNATTDQTLLRNMANVPQAISPAIGFSEYDLRPFYPYTAIPATTIGLIYLIILSFFSFALSKSLQFAGEAQDLPIYSCHWPTLSSLWLSRSTFPAAIPSLRKHRSRILRLETLMLMERALSLCIGC
jgi:hypothetical protein